MTLKLDAAAPTYLEGLRYAVVCQDDDSYPEFYGEAAFRSLAEATGFARLLRDNDVAGVQVVDLTTSDTVG